MNVPAAALAEKVNFLMGGGPPKPLVHRSLGVVESEGGRCR
jgi:hypothetical protein